MAVKHVFSAALFIAAAPAFAQSGASMPAASTSAFNVDMPIEVLAADPKARAVLEAVFPGMTSHAMFDQFKIMTVKQLQPMASDQITDAGIAKLTTELAALK